MVKDPICGMMVDENDEQAQVGARRPCLLLLLRGCKAQFDRDPHRYGHAH